MSHPRILVACIGNIFLGDDGFGPEVARRLAARTLPPEVSVKDFGIRGLDPTYALLDPCELTILVDACPRGGEPGSVYLIEPDPLTASAEPPRLEAHAMNPMNVLRTVRAMGGAPGRILIVGCEPADLGPEDGQMGLSEPAQAAVDEAVVLIEALVSRFLKVELAAIGTDQVGDAASPK
jgi:hydrogenase maturation protease